MICLAKLSSDMDIDAAQSLHDHLVSALPSVVAGVFSAAFETSGKGASGLDFVTSIDLAMQARLERDLSALLPTSLVLGEEGYVERSAPADDQTPVWLVDPLDGTVNFVAGLASYAVAIVLLVAGRPVLAAVHDVPQQKTYSAIAGGGAFLDGRPMVRRDHAARLGVLSSGLLRDLAQHDPAALAEILAAYKLRNFGSQAMHLCYAAAGQVSFVASREAKGWDDFAGALIAREAGLFYGQYVSTATPAIDADQYSLCCVPDLYNGLAAILARSVAGPSKS